MNKWPIWKRIRLLWVLIAAAGVVVSMTSMFPSLAMVHAQARTNQRLWEIRRMPADATVPVTAYKVACDDAINMTEIAANGIMPVLIPGGLIVLLALLGSRLNRRIRQMEEEAQPTTPPYSEPAARSPQG